MVEIPKQEYTLGPGRTRAIRAPPRAPYDASHTGWLDPSIGDGLSHQGFVSLILSTGPRCFSVQ